MPNEEIIFGQKGHNSRSLADSAQADAKDAVSQYAPRLQEFLDALARITVTNRGDAGDATDKVGLAKAFGDIVDEQRSALNEPFREARDRTNAVFRDFLEPLSEAIDIAMGKIDAYRKAAQARVEAQKAQQPQIETLLPPQNPIPGSVLAPPPSDVPPPPKPVRDAAPVSKPIRGALGKRFTVRENRRFVLVDRTKVPDFILDSTPVREAMEKVATSMIKNIPAIEGFAVETSEKANVQ